MKNKSLMSFLALLLILGFLTPVLADCNYRCMWKTVYFENRIVQRTEIEPLADAVTRNFTIPARQDYFIKIHSQELSKLYVRVQNKDSLIYEEQKDLPRPDAYAYFHLGHLSKGEYTVILIPYGPIGGYANFWVIYW
ncbi:MAG: hypothetical protein ACE5KT_09955 [Methanosarcinales archaeon]